MREVIDNSNFFAPYGMAMEGRNFVGGFYRFGYNGGEKIDEILGKNTYVDLGERGVDVRLARLGWKIDPRASEYAWQSPYAYYANSPIWMLDYKGMGEGDEKVAIDPGHGIKGTENPIVDPGSVGNGHKEKDIALDIAQTVNCYLTEWNANTVMTRTGDLTVNQKQISYRLEVAKDNSADIFLSIHTNSVKKDPKRPDYDPSGFLVCYHPQTTAANSLSLAKEIVGAQSVMPISGTGYQTRDDLGVLKYKGNASVLVEVGFISNANDVQLMTTSFDQIGKEIALGVYRYIYNTAPPKPQIPFSVPKPEIQQDYIKFPNNLIRSW